MKLKQLIGGDMLAQNRMLHEGKGGFGGSGWKHSEAILAFAHELGAKTILDYGCGECTLSRVLKRDYKTDLRITEYDPAVEKRSAMPGPADLVVCTDVLEHVEPDKLEAVLIHLCGLTVKGCYLVAATRPANKILPNGNNAHLIIEQAPWWRERVQAHAWKIVREEDRRKGNGYGHEYRMWLTK